MGCVKLNSLGWSLTGSNVIFVNIDFTELIAAVSSTVLSRKKGKIILNSRSALYCRYLSYFIKAGFSYYFIKKYN